MSNSAVASLTAGAIFGAALSAAGVSPPGVIIAQMRLQDLHMLKVFMTASASSALAMLIARKYNFAQCKPRPAASLGWLHGYDGNIIGGALLGAGMTLTGSCPGTVLVQIASGLPSGLAVAAGCLTGGVAYARYAPYLRRPVPSSSSETAATQTQEKPKLTVFEAGNVKESHTILAYELMCLGVVLLALYFNPTRDPVLLHPILGGLAIGIAQFASLVLTGSSVGVSSAYEQIGKYFWKWWDSITGPSNKSTSPGTSSIVFAIGILLGSLSLKNTFPFPAGSSDLGVSTLKAVLGGFVMVFGARMAGGCTSGHGISGMSTLSISSFVTIASTFAGGIGLSYLLDH